jgi:hypothetical protein
MTAVGQPRSLLQVLHDINSLSELVDNPNEEVRSALAAIIPVLRPADQSMEQSERDSKRRAAA